MNKQRQIENGIKNIWLCATANHSHCFRLFWTIERVRHIAFGCNNFVCQFLSLLFHYYHCCYLSLMLVVDRAKFGMRAILTQLWRVFCSFGVQFNSMICCCQRCVCVCVYPECMFVYVLCTPSFYVYSLRTQHEYDYPFIRLSYLSSLKMLLHFLFQNYCHVNKYNERGKH